MISLTAFGGNTVGYKTAAANTAFYAVAPPDPSYYTRLVSLEVTNGATANPVYLMRPLTTPGGTSGYAVVQTAQVATDTTLVLDHDPSPSGNTIASGDQVLYQATDGTIRQVTVSSWSASTLTLTVSALPAAVAAGATMWNFGVYTDTEPTTSLAFPQVPFAASATTEEDFEVGFAGWIAGAPLLLYCPNATNQTYLNRAEYAYTTF